MLQITPRVLGPRVNETSDEKHNLPPSIISDRQWPLRLSLLKFKFDFYTGV